MSESREEALSRKVREYTDAIDSLTKLRSQAIGELLVLRAVGRQKTNVSS